MKKITVKHYINKRLKCPSLYVRVIYDRKDTTFPSEIVSNINPSEKQFLEDLTLKREMEYEAEIITSIIQFCINLHKENFTFSQINFSSVIHTWKDSVPDKYFFTYIENKEVRQKVRVPLLNFISEHTKIKLETIDKIVNYSLEELDALLDLVKNHDIYDIDIKQTILFCNLLYEYERIYYYKPEPIGKWIYGADNMFGYYEWKDKKGKEQFEKYALKQNILPKEFVKDRISDFDIELSKGIETALYLSNFTDTKRNPK